MATAGRGTAAKKVRRKEKKNVVAGHAHIKSTFNNTVISICDDRSFSGTSSSATG